MSINNSYSEFKAAVGNADPNLVFIANKMPKKGMTSFESDPKGNFTVTYEGKIEGKVTPSDPDWEKTLNGVSIKVDQVVKGKIVPGTDAEPGRIEFQSGIVAIKESGSRLLPNANIKLKSVQAIAESTDYLVTGQWGPFSQPAQLSQDMVNFTQIKWKA